MRRLPRFPNPVNETSARLVAAGVVPQAVAFLVVREWWVLVPLAYGFVARVVSGPAFSPLGLFVTKAVTPRLAVQHRFVAGPPKRFAQGIGAAFSVGALLASAFGAVGLAMALIAGLAVAAFLEAAFALCLGCIAFAQLMRAGVIPDAVCVECADISARLVQSPSR